MNYHYFTLCPNFAISNFKPNLPKDKGQAANNTAKIGSHYTNAVSTIESKKIFQPPKVDNLPLLSKVLESHTFQAAFFSPKDYEPGDKDLIDDEDDQEEWEYWNEEEDYRKICGSAKA
jgi:hypothetical protein